MSDKPRFVWTFESEDDFFSFVEKAIDIGRAKGLATIEVSGVFTAHFMPAMPIPKPPITEAEAERREQARRADPVKSRLDEEDELLFGDQSNG